jgi:hypothetical protein
MSTSEGLLHCKASRARVSQFWLKTDGGATAGGACGIIRSHGSEVKDGRFDSVGCEAVEVGPNYPSLDVIFTINRTIWML